MKKKKYLRKAFSLLLSFAMVLTMIPATTATAFADTQTITKVGTQVDVSGLKYPQNEYYVSTFQIYSGGTSPEWEITTNGMENMTSADILNGSAATPGKKAVVNVNVTLEESVAADAKLTIAIGKSGSKIRYKKADGKFENLSVSTSFSVQLVNGEAQYTLQTYKDYTGMTGGTYQYRTDWVFNFKIAKHEHNFNNYVVNPEDATTHLKECTCKETEGPAEAHTWDQCDVTTAPTLDTDGERTYTCKCGETRTEVFPALGVIPQSLEIRMVAVDGSADNIHTVDYQYTSSSPVIDAYVAKYDSKFTFAAFDENNKEVKNVIWSVPSYHGTITSDGVFTPVSELNLGVYSFADIKAEVGYGDYYISDTEEYVLTSFRFHPAYINPVVKLSEDGQTVVKDNINAGAKGHTTWTVSYPETNNAAKIIETGVIQDGIEFGFIALRPGKFDLTYKVDFDEDFTETTTVTVKGVAVEDKDGKQQKTYVEIGNDKPTATTQLTAYTAAGLKVTEWYSNDTNVATVDQNGLVTAKGVGSVIINAVDSEGNVGGIKVVVDHADIPYFRQIDFALGNEGINTHRWSKDYFKADKFEYDIYTTQDSAVTITLNANTEYNKKWKATANYTDSNGNEQTVTVNSGEATYLTNIPKGAFTFTVTLEDRDNSENKNVYTFNVNRPAPTSIDIRLVKVNGSEDIFYKDYEDADDYEDWVVMDDNLYIGKDGDKFTFVAYAQDGREALVKWTINEDLAESNRRGTIDKNGVFTVDYLTFAGTSFHYVKTTSLVNPEVTQEKMFVMTGYGLHPYYKDLEVKLSEDGQTKVKANVNAGVKGHTTWTESFPETNAAKIEKIGVAQDGIEYDFYALRPGKFTVTYKVNNDESMTETANVTVKGVAVEDKDGKQQKTYVEIGKNNPTAKTQLTAYTAAGLKVTEWYSNDTGVATVDKNGLVTARGVGSVIINAVDSEGNVGGIKVVVTHADIPYLVDFDFATGFEGLNPFLWTEDTFKATKTDYNIYPYTSSAVALAMNAEYNADKYTAEYNVTFSNGKEETNSLSATETTYCSIVKKDAEPEAITITLTDKANSKNKTVYTFNVINTGTYEGGKLAENGITLVPYGRELSASEKYNKQLEGTMITEGDKSFRTYIRKGDDKFFLNLCGSTNNTIIRYSIEGDMSTWDGWHRLPQHGQTKLIRFPEKADTVKITVQTISDGQYLDNVNDSVDAFNGAAEYTLWVEQVAADKTGGSGAAGGAGAAVQGTTPEAENNSAENTGSGSSVDAVVSGENTSIKTENGETKAETVINKALAEKILKDAADKKTEEIVLKIEDDATKGAGKIEVKVDTSTIKGIADSSAALTVKTEAGTISLDQKTLEAVASEAKGTTVSLEIKAVGTPTEAHKAAAGENGHIIQLTIKSGDKTISDFKTGKVNVTVEIPDKLADKKVAVVHIGDDGKVKHLMGKEVIVGGKKHYSFDTPHFSTFALVDAEEIGLTTITGEEVKALIEDLTPTARSSKTAKGIKVALKLDTADKEIIAQLEDAGCTVKYKFYRSMKKASKYESKLTTSKTTYTNTVGKSGNKYYYKAVVQVYDAEGKLIAKTALKQCKYASRTWTK